VDRLKGTSLDRKHFIVDMTHRGGTQPQVLIVYLRREKTLSYTPGKKDHDQAVDTDLAKQLSFMTLLDALNSQRDRFGIYGSNLEAMLNYRDGTFKISAVDNGGIAHSFDTSSLKYFLRATTRFEREVAERVLELDEFLRGERAS